MSARGLRNLVRAYGILVFVSIFVATVLITCWPVEVGLMVLAVVCNFRLGETDGYLSDKLDWT
jgi:hypothetical protein